MSSYWEFRSFKAGRLPTISFQFSPLQYTNSITQRYDYEQNIDIFRQQQSFSSSGGISVSQKLDLTGGTFTLNTGLSYLRSLGEYVNTQFSSTPFRLGYSQSLFGVNSFKWSKKIEPLKYEKTQKQSITSYTINKQRFIVGRVDINTVTLSLNRRKEAQRNYLSILSNYWKCYYNIRKLTLFDFENQESLSYQFDKLLE